MYNIMCYQKVRLEIPSETPSIMSTANLNVTDLI